MKIVICWNYISGYLAAGWRALAAMENVDLSIIMFNREGTSQAPFSPELTRGLDCHCLPESDKTHQDKVRAMVENLNPDVLIVPGWLVPAYMELTRAPNLRNKRFIMTMDTPYRGTMRQKLARLKIAWYLKNIDRAMVPGERSFQFARRLGFSESQIQRGVYALDFAILEPLYEQRIAQSHGQWPRRFLYMARYAEEKALDVLMEGYRLYRERAKDPWPLTMCGAGPLVGLIQGHPGVTDRGFVQPADQPEVWLSHGAFVISSRHEPWSVALCEACAAGLPVVCTDACGASVEMVRSCYNGMVVATDDAESLAGGLLWIHDHQEQCPEMGRRAREFARAYSAQMWAQRVVLMCQELMEGKHVRIKPQA